MFASIRRRPPAASAAVHVLNPRKPGMTGLCGVDLTGEPELPYDTTVVTCPVCATRNR
ncbi:hypothetical protein ACLQ24_21510 [Micromonospora sp. DT4]|uniref:hypothetical protein n=1 Tax=Micromonospora sp. DT4 TaxID=3393438 RepID=UPI003CF5B5E6